MLHTSISSPLIGPFGSEFSAIAADVRHQLRTERLELVPISLVDLGSYEELFADPAVMKQVGLEAGATLNCDEARSVIKGAVDAWKNRGYGRWTMFDRMTGDFIGFCGFRAEQGVPELICMMHECYWGRGLAAEAARSCLECGFTKLGFTKVRSFCRPGHLRARAALNKVGARFLSNIDFHGVEGAEYLISPDMPAAA